MIQISYGEFFVELIFIDTAKGTGILINLEYQNIITANC